MLPFVNLLGLSLPTYGLCLICGVLLAGLIALAGGRRCSLPKQDIIFCGIYCGLGGLIGAKIGYLLAHGREIALLWREAADKWELITSLAQSGFLLFGGIIGGLLAFFIYCRQYRVDADQLAPCLIPTAPLLTACCRLGCFGAGCCYGVAWEGPLAIVNTHSLLGLNGVPLFPVQLLAVILNLALFLIMLTWPPLRPPAPACRIVGFYLAMCAVGRFGLEFLRGDHGHELWPGFSGMQWFCLPLLLLGLCLIWRSQHKAA